MTPLPRALGGKQLIVWRLDHRKHRGTWNSGEGARLNGGRWSSRGRKVVYCAVDPATAILEVAVHKTFRVLDTVPHVLTSAAIVDPSLVEIVRPNRVPNRHWLRPGSVSAGQQAFGDDLLTRYRFILIPSVVSRHSWNLIFDADIASGHYKQRTQEPFALDPRLHLAT